jgi:ribosomal protein S12 methylthiotransferase
MFKEPGRFGIHSAKFANAGWKVEFDAPSSGQDLVIINTCGFIGDARQESIDMILEYARRKNHRQNR